VNAGEPAAPHQYEVEAELMHDLRTPLNHIIGYSELMLEEVRTDGEVTMAPYLQKVVAAGHHLLGLINEHFRASRPEAAERVAGAPPPPVEAEPPAAVASPPADPAASAAARGAVLVVDDVEANRDLLSQRVTREGYWVATAASGREALERMAVETFDLVLLDIMMPEMDGFEVLRRMAADGRLRKVAVIVVSALSDVESLAKCIELGADDYLRKPFDATLLRARVRASLDRKRARDREAYLLEQLQDNRRRLKELGGDPARMSAPGAPRLPAEPPVRSPLSHPQTAIRNRSE
jgi:CheY-like chemotaxis protein